MKAFFWGIQFLIYMGWFMQSLDLRFTGYVLFIGWLIVAITNWIWKRVNTHVDTGVMLVDYLY